MEKVKARCVAVWAPEGLECREMGDEYLIVAVPPKFAIGPFCGDMVVKFNAEVESLIDETNALRLVITMRDPPIDDRPSSSRWILILWLAAAVCPAVAYGLTVREGLL